MHIANKFLKIKKHKPVCPFSYRNILAWKNNSWSCKVDDNVEINEKQELDWIYTLKQFEPLNVF